ncbi:MAG TPA: hypothetical protein VF789_00035 [Thermoanaerobaculia bacterium]
MRRVVIFTGGALALGLAAVVAWAAPAPQSGVFRVSSCTTCRQERPVVAGLTTGAFMSVWEGTSTKDAEGVSGRLFTAAGAAPAVDFLVNKDVAPDQFDAAITRDVQGNFVVVWSEVANGNSEIRAQRYLPTGAVLGAPIQVSLDAPGKPTIPADFNPVVARTKEGFVVIWMSLLPASASFEGTKPEVLARRFNSAGSPLGSPVKINTGLVNGDRPDVCVDTTGRIVAVWTVVDQFAPFQSTRKGVSLRRFSNTLAPLEPEQVVAAPQATTVQPAVSCGSGSTFVVAWHTDLPPAADRTDILAQRYSRLGRKVGAAFRVNSNTAGYQRNPSIAHDAKGNFVVVWQADLGAREGIFGRRFTAAAAPTGADFEVVSDVDNATEPAWPRVDHVGTAGNFVVVWQDGARAIFGRRYAP